MKYKGVNYDTGTEYRTGILTRDDLDRDMAVSDMDAIRNRLNCNSVRIYGKEPDKLLLAAEIALQTGLNVWLSPRLIDGTQDDTLIYLDDVASRFESLRKNFREQETILIIGGEMTIDTKGFLPGETIHQRIANMSNPLFFLKSAIGIKPNYQDTFDSFLTNASVLVREKFSGKITYAAGIWEKVNWEGFDFISVNFYKASFNKAFYNRRLRKMASCGKPLIITEFGCCCFEGADKMGPTGYTVLDLSKKPPEFRKKCVRNEKVQSGYIMELLNTYEREKITGAFVFDFYAQKHTYDTDPEKDYDMASLSITRSMGKKNWEPKESFHRIAGYYLEH